MNISIKKKGRKQEVPVKVEKPESGKDPIFGCDNKEELAKIAAEFTDMPEYLDLEEDVYSKKNLAEQLSLLKPKEMRKVVSAARYLRKFKDLLEEDNPKPKEDCDDLDEIWEED